MIIGIGVDIIEINRIKKLFSYKNDKFANKILNKYEFLKYKFCKNKINFLAKHFSVKEATVKAFGIGMRNGLTFNKIEIYKNNLGKPMLKFYKEAKIFSKKIGVNKIHISISHERYYIYSLVILES
uniref:holo-ACP synthase n=1 Tax=Sodalis-like secondary symbiont of Drepanosiphum platanoidis TaxID=2994493 RepID=UPI003F5C766B